MLFRNFLHPTPSPLFNEIVENRRFAFENRSQFVETEENGMEYGGWIGRYLGFGEGGIFEIRGAVEAIADGFVERLKINTP